MGDRVVFVLVCFVFGLVCVLCVSVFSTILTFSILLCRFLCLVICVLVRVCLVFILASSVICPSQFYFVSVLGLF